MDYLSCISRWAENLGVPADGGIVVVTASLQSISNETRDDEDLQKLLEAVQHQQWHHSDISHGASPLRSGLAFSFQLSF